MKTMKAAVFVSPGKIQLVDQKADRQLWVEAV
jgi:hypothetical protein